MLQIDVKFVCIIISNMMHARQIVWKQHRTTNKRCVSENADIR